MGYRSVLWFSYRLKQKVWLDQISFLHQIRDKLPKEWLRGVVIKGILWLSLWSLLNIQSVITTTGIFSFVLFYSKGYEWQSLSWPGAHNVNVRMRSMAVGSQRWESTNEQQIWVSNFKYEQKACGSVASLWSCFSSTGPHFLVLKFL